MTGEFRAVVAEAKPGLAALGDDRVHYYIRRHAEP